MASQVFADLSNETKNDEKEKKKLLHSDQSDDDESSDSDDSDPWSGLTKEERKEKKREWKALKEFKKQMKKAKKEVEKEAKRAAKEFKKKAEAIKNAENPSVESLSGNNLSEPVDNSSGKTNIDSEPLTPVGDHLIDDVLQFRRNP